MEARKRVFHHGNAETPPARHPPRAGFENPSVFQKIGSLRTSTNNLSIEQVVKLKEKATKGEWAMPFLKK